MSLYIIFIIKRLTRLIEAGIYQKIVRDELKGSHCYDDLTKLATDDVKPLTIKEIQAAFYLLILGDYYSIILTSLIWVLRYDPSSFLLQLFINTETGFNFLPV